MSSPSCSRPSPSRRASNAARAAFILLLWAAPARAGFFDFLFGPGEDRGPRERKPRPPEPVEPAPAPAPPAPRPADVIRMSPGGPYPSRLSPQDPESEPSRLGVPERFPLPDPSVMERLQPPDYSRFETAAPIEGGVRYGAAAGARPAGVGAGRAPEGSMGRYRISVPEVGPAVEVDPGRAREGPALVRSAPRPAPGTRVESAPVEDERRVVRQLSRPPSLPAPAAGAGQGARGLLVSADRRLAAGDLAGALMDLQKAVDLAPEDPQARLLLAWTLVRLGRFEEAEPAAEAAARLAPDDPGAHEVLAWVRLHLGKNDAAIASATRAIKLAPDSARAYAIRAMAHEQKGDRKSMLDDLGMADSLDSGRFGGHLRAARAGRRLFVAGSADSRALLGALPEPLVRRLWPWLAGVLALGALGLGLRGRWERLIREKYRMGPLVGRGGAGPVWQAFDRTLERPVAVRRLLYIDAGAARARAGLRHPNLEDVYDVIEGRSGLYLVSESPPARTLGRLLREGGALAPARARAILEPVCDALLFAHERGLAHGALAPEKIALGEGDHVKLFGLGLRDGARYEDDLRGLGECLKAMVEGGAAGKAVRRALGQASVRDFRGALSGLGS